MYIIILVVWNKKKIWVYQTSQRWWVPFSFFINIPKQSFTVTNIQAMYVDKRDHWTHCNYILKGFYLTATKQCPCIYLKTFWRIFFNILKCCFLLHNEGQVQLSRFILLSLFSLGPLSRLKVIHITLFVQLFENPLTKSV